MIIFLTVNVVSAEKQKAAKKIGINLISCIKNIGIY